MPADQNQSRDNLTTDQALLCKQCGARAVRPRACSGRTCRFRNMAALGISDDFVILTCSRCRTEILDAQTRQELEGVLLDAYHAALRIRVRRAIDTLCRFTSQRQLERWLGLSQGYLSRLRSGAGTPSPELLSNLAILSKDPKVRLEELANFWAEPTFPRALTSSPAQAHTGHGGNHE